MEAGADPVGEVLLGSPEDIQQWYSCPCDHNKTFLTVLSPMHPCFRSSVWNGYFWLAKLGDRHMSSGFRRGWETGSALSGFCRWKLGLPLMILPPVPVCGGSSHALPGSSQTPDGCPTVELKAHTGYLETAVDSTG